MSALFRASDPETSRQAAASIRDINAHQALIYSVLLRIGPATHQDILAELDAVGAPISESGARTRCKELCERGLVVDSGLRGVTASGRSSVMWKAVRP